VTASPRSSLSLLRALGDVLAPTGFPYASNGRLFKDAEFGRDSLETAEDLLPLRPGVARAVILRLAALQGTIDDVRTEEEPGKIHHEYRSLVMYGRPVAEESARIFRELARNWHLAETEEELLTFPQLTQYGTVDASALFVRLAGRYCARHGTGILDETYIPRRPGTAAARATIRDSVRAAVRWTVAMIEASDVGLLEWQRKTSWGHCFQAWKDGGTSYLHEDGTYANYNGPMASVEVQGLAYDALLAAVSLLAGDLPEELERYAALARRVQEQTLALLWMPDRDYFAMGLDRDPETGGVRQIRVLTSNPGALLETGIFDSLPPEERNRYVLPVVERIVGEDFLTSVGIRCTSLAYRNLLPYPAYQSSYTVWHKETFDVAKGLRRQGFPLLADEVERRLLNVIDLAGPREFIYVLPDGRFGPIRGATGRETVVLRSTNIPENEQAWTIAAGLAVKWRLGRRVQAGPASPPPPLERDLLARTGTTALFRTVAEVEHARNIGYVCDVHTTEGCEAEGEWVREHALSSEP
jgi:glycogen debranching enzyme